MSETTTRPPPPPPRVDLARAALRGPVKELRSGGRHVADEDATAAALAQLEGRFLSQIEDLKEALQERDRPSQLHVIAPPMPAPEKKHWAVQAGTVAAGVLTGAAALVGAMTVFLSTLKQPPPPELTTRIDVCEKQLGKVHDWMQVQRAYDIKTRQQWRGAFEAQGVRFPYAPGEPVTEPIELLPAPVIDAHKVSKVPRIQPSEPIPLPPDLPELKARP